MPASKVDFAYSCVSSPYTFDFILLNNVVWTKPACQPNMPVISNNSACSRSCVTHSASCWHMQYMCLTTVLRLWTHYLQVLVWLNSSMSVFGCITCYRFWDSHVHTFPHSLLCISQITQSELIQFGMSFELQFCLSWDLGFRTFHVPPRPFNPWKGGQNRCQVIRVQFPPA